MHLQIQPDLLNLDSNSQGMVFTPWQTIAQEQELRPLKALRDVAPDKGEGLL